MRFEDRYPIIVTPHKNACRDFWQSKLGFEVVFDSTWFTLVAAEEGSATLAFMTPDHPSAPPGADAYQGKGMCFELQVGDADAVFAQMSANGLKASYPLTTELFGQRRFGFFDPSGLWVDVVQQVEPQAGYWDRYMQ
jgi:catechol 2,3-dioxygenase-like lactoylglutathione lyase family enzyme